MLPLSDGLHPRRFPIVNVALIAANFAVWIFYELPHLSSAVYHASFYACAVNNACHAPEPWGGLRRPRHRKAAQCGARCPAERHPSIGARAVMRRVERRWSR